MKFSVVVPLYNKEHYIKNTVESALKQTYGDYEIVIVNDGSTDNSLNVALSIVSDKVRVVNQVNQGASVARNTGVENAKGDYIAFLDADDEWREDYLKTISLLIENHPECDIFTTAYEVVIGNRKRHSALISGCDGVIDSYWTTYQYSYEVVWTSATVIRRDAVFKAGMFKPGELIGQDLDLIARVAVNNPKVAHSPKVCARYNRGAEHNARTRVKVAFPKAFLKVLHDQLQNPERSEEEKKWIGYKYDKKMIVYIFTMILNGERAKARRTLIKWNKYRKCIYQPFLYVSSFLPNIINSFVYNVRLKVF